MRPVNVGDPILPALTAKWYNDTLKTLNDRKPLPPGKKIPREGLVYCSVASGASDAAEYTEVYISGVISDGSEQGPPILEVNNTGTLTEDVTFGIAQEPVTAGATILCCFSGISKLGTTPASKQGYGVIWDENLNTFARTRGTGWRRLGSDGTYDIVLIGPTQDCNRVRGTLTGALLSSGGGTLTNLLGINAPAIFLDDPLTVTNPHGYEADSGALARAEWVYGNNAWEIYQVTCPE
jgi:hypothetical protein